MPEPIDDKLILGEIRGQLREVVHSQNNMNMKIDGLTREVIGFAAIAEDVGELKSDVRQLKEHNSRRAGAEGTLATIVKSPLIQWIATVALAVYIFFAKQHAP
jgi:hypothetical protein